MAWPRDEAKLERVRSLLVDAQLDALVVRAPDNVLYLTNFWGMKGYDACVFPREGEPVLICLEASAEDAERTAWTADVRFFRGYDEADPRPPIARTLDAAVAAAAGYDRVGVELSLGTQAADRMVGEPTTYTKAWFDSFRGAVDATPLLSRARAIKTAQEIERLRIANEIAAEAMEHVRARLEAGMRESEAAAIWHLPVTEDEPVLFEIWVCADGYWADHTKNLVLARLREDYEELLAGLVPVYEAAVDHCRPGASLGELDRLVRDGIAKLGYAGQPSHPICHGVGARAHEPPYAHQAAGGTVEEGMVLAIEPGVYWQGGGGLRLEDNFLITKDGAQKLSSFPDGVVACR